MKTKHPHIVLASLLALSLFLPVARAATLVVTSLQDDGPGTLRALISGPLRAGDTIRFADNLSGKSIVLTSGEVQLDQQMTIDASTLPGGIRIDGSHHSRIFNVFANVTAVLESLTLTNGYAPAGGGIINNGTLTLNRCAIVGNSVSSGGGGGGINNNFGVLTLNQCTVAGNSANLGGGAGGGIFNLAGNSSVTLNQCTVSGNLASVSGGLGGFNFGAANVPLFSLFNCIVAGNGAGTDPNMISGKAPVLLGNNFTNGPPLLASLGNYGGPTPTMPPLAVSPAIGAGSDSATSAPYNFATDQRGLPRLAGAHVDIGAVELQPPLVVTTSADSGPGSLRAVVAAATFGNTINFVGELSGQSIVLTGGEIPLNNNLWIDASALPAGITLSGNNANRIFNVGAGVNIDLIGLTITQGRTSGSGGAIYSAAGSSLHIERSAFTGNSGFEGGAILNDGALLMENCTLTANNGSYGGALQCRYLTTLIHCTLFGNDAPAGGGGIFNKYSTLTLNNSIVAGNSSSIDGQDIYSQLAALVFVNANLISNRLEDRPSAPTIGPIPLTGDPLLGPPGNYGGPTPALLPISGSPAIDSGGPTVLTSDQRGVLRNFGSAPDLGAIEYSFEATTRPATGANNTVATLNGAVNPYGLDITTWFEWGAANPDYSRQSSTTIILQSGLAPVAVSSLLSDLTPGQIYHSRLVASNAWGVVHGGDVLFGSPAIELKGDSVVTLESPTVFIDPGATAIGPPVAISSELFHSLALKSDGTVVGWGKNDSGQISVPSGLNNVVAISAGANHSLALKGDGTVIGWGINDKGQSSVPSGLNHVVAISAGVEHSLALTSDGMVVVWGDDHREGIDFPAGLSNVVSISAGLLYSLALKHDRTVVGWGYDGSGQASVPVGLSNVVAISAGANHSLALKSDGTVVGWGFNGDGETTIPSGLNHVVAIAAQGIVSLALKSDGTGVAWGNNHYGQVTLPVGLSNVLAIAAGARHCLALKSDGTVVAWGDNGFGQASVPAGLGVFGASVAGSVNVDVPGRYALTYTSTNILGGVATATRTVIVKSTPPSITPPFLTAPARLADGSFQFAFSNLAGTPFTIFASADMGLPLNQWSNLGPAVEILPGQFRFTDPHAIDQAQRYYLVTSP